MVKHDTKKVFYRLHYEQDMVNPDAARNSQMRNLIYGITRLT